MKPVNKTEQKQDFFATAANIADKTIAIFNPEQAIKNKMMRGMMATNSYDSARRGSRAYGNRSVHASSADSDMIYDLPTIRQYSRDADRNDPIATGITKTKTTNVIGSGLRFQSSPDWEYLGITKEQGKELSKLIEREFDMYLSSTECDATRHSTGYGQQRIWHRQKLVNGEAIINITTAPLKDRPQTPYTMVLQAIESDRLSNPMGGINTKDRIDGIEKDAFGAPVAYWICDGHPGNSLFVDPKQFTWSRFPAFDRYGNRKVIHYYNKFRDEQSRGVPDLAPILEFLKLIKDMLHIELDAARTAALMAIFITTESGKGFAFPSGLDGTTTADGTETKPYELGSGGIINLKTGEDVKSPTPGRPNDKLAAFIMAVQEHMGAAVEMPVEIMIKHFTASYSAAQAAFLEFWKYVTVERADFADQVMNPIKVNWFYEAVAIGRLDLPGFFQDYGARQAYIRGSWRGPAKGMINEQNEVRAALDKVSGGLSSRRVEAERFGNDFEEIITDILHENELLGPVGQPNFPTQTQVDNTGGSN